MLDDHGGDGAVEGGGEEGPAVVVGGVEDHVTLEAEGAVPASHQGGGLQPVDAHVALLLGRRRAEGLQERRRGGGVRGRRVAALLRGPLGEAHVHLQVGQEPVGGVDGRQEEVFVAPAPA